MKAKQEVIQEAWGKNYEEFKENIDDNGWAIYPHFQKHEMIENIMPIEFRFNSSDFRPKSLQGIETNNGWTIADITKLPTEGKYNVGFLLDDGTFHLGNDEVEWYELREYVVDFGFTHYQPIIKPNAPIY